MTVPPAAPTSRRPPDLDFGYRTRTVRLGRFSRRLGLRLAVVSSLFFALAVAGALWALTIGDFPLTLGQVWTALGGGGEDFPRTVVLEWRLPVAIAAVVFGALLGLGGAVFQSLTRNPLGSPDVIGFDAGAYTAVVVTILVIGNRSYWPVAVASTVGGLATAIVVYLLAYRQGIQGFRLIIVGIAVSAVLGSANSYLMSRADIDDAMAVGFWGAGSIARVTWSSLVPSLLLAGVVVGAATLLSPALHRLELGDDAAVTLGSRPNRSRTGLLVVGVVAVAVVTAAAGPIAFVALTAPQIARRLTRSPGVSLPAAAGTGATLLVGAHLVSLFLARAGRPVPVGLITVCLGGLYLIRLLIRETRRQYGTPR